MITIVALAVGIVVARVLSAAWMVMMLIGALHSLHPQVPALGFVTCVLGVLIVTILLYSGPTGTVRAKEPRGTVRAKGEQ